MVEEVVEDVEATTREADSPPREPTADGKRKRSSIVFAYTPLSDAVDIVRAVERRGHACTLDELAAEMNQQMTSGAFRNKLSTARIFGVIDTSRGSVSLTDIGLRLANPDTHPHALADAFMNVPLYRALYDQFAGNNLPPDQGIEATMRRLGVPEKQTTKARQVLYRSAELAGFFKAGRNRLVRPAGSSVATGSKDAPAPGERHRSGAEAVPMAEHPLIKGLVAKLPPEGETFTPKQRQRWLDAAKVNLELIYADTDDAPVPEPTPNGVATGQPQSSWHLHPAAQESASVPAPDHP
jgi:hypothetical protein